MLNQTADRIDWYPTRIDVPPKILVRRDPVLHGGMQSPGPMESAMLSAYERNGFLAFDRFFFPEEIEVYRDELDRLRNDADIANADITITEPDSGAVRSIFSIETVSEIFAGLASNARLLEIAQQLLADDVYLHQSRVNLKPGFTGKEFYWHSDFETWHAEDGMPRMRAVSCSISLTDNFPFNGPLMLIPGSHYSFVQCQGKTPANHYHASLKKQEIGVPDPDSLSALAHRHGIEAPAGPAGSVVFFECNTMHGSNSNITPFPRSNVFLVYNSVSNALEEPFAAGERRPWFLASREATPLSPHDPAAMAEFRTST